MHTLIVPRKDKYLKLRENEEVNLQIYLKIKKRVEIFNAKCEVNIYRTFKDDLTICLVGKKKEEATNKRKYKWKIF